ncbi:hypothetical protein CVT25_012502 [Psilocybe cyanescens]|uniref:Uncharacterized protein n=1 Tax=Psilocybe cyanescens TaxID=93625 RepID=A0A409XHF1_PSICY|nr:hypothetical protein CVT25_012502 [Psilocybe cyanescens]
MNRLGLLANYNEEDDRIGTGPDRRPRLAFGHLPWYIKGMLPKLYIGVRREFAPHAHTTALSAHPAHPARPCCGFFPLPVLAESQV